MIERRPIRSPLQQEDLKKKAPTSSQSPEWMAVDKIKKEAEDLIALKEELQSSIEEAKATLEEIKQVQKGEPGDPGEKGESVFTHDDLLPYLQWMMEQVKGELSTMLPKDGENGKDGKTPVLGVDYFTIPHQTAMVEKIMSKLPNPKDGISPEIDHEKLADHVLENIIKGKRLTKKDIAGLDEEITSYRSQMAHKQAGQHGGGTTIRAGSGIIATVNSDGTTTLSAPGAAASPLTPTGLVNASNTSYVVLSRPSSVIADGITYYEGFGYSYAALNIVLDVPPSQYIRYYA